MRKRRVASARPIEVFSRALLCEMKSTISYTRSCQDVGPVLVGKMRSRTAVEMFAPSGRREVRFPCKMLEVKVSKMFGDATAAMCMLPREQSVVRDCGQVVFRGGFSAAG